MTYQNHTMTIEEFEQLQPSQQLKVIKAMTDHAEDILAERPVEQLVLLTAMQECETLPSAFSFIVNWLGADVAEVL